MSVLTKSQLSTILPTAKSPMPKKSISYRFVLTSELENVLSYLEHIYYGLDKSEILKLALNQLYRANKNDDKVVEEVASTSGKYFKSENQAFDWWNKQK
jgi:hypothetical protein